MAELSEATAVAFCVRGLPQVLPGSPQHLVQCRFCLEEAREEVRPLKSLKHLSLLLNLYCIYSHICILLESFSEDFITPCKCEGTSRQQLSLVSRSRFEASSTRRASGDGRRRRCALSMRSFAKCAARRQSQTSLRLKSFREVFESLSLFLIFFWFFLSVLARDSKAHGSELLEGAGVGGGPAGKVFPS